MRISAMLHVARIWILAEISPLPKRNPEEINFPCVNCRMMANSVSARLNANHIKIEKRRSFDMLCVNDFSLLRCAILNLKSSSA